MCPCVLYEKLKNAMGMGRRSERSSRGSDRSTESGGNSDSTTGDTTNKRRSEKKTVNNSRDLTNTRSSDDSKMKNKVELIGQVLADKPDPKDFALKVIQTERPDLITLDIPLNAGELKTLDDYLLKKGEMRNGITFNLGELVDKNSSLRVGEGDEVEMMMLYAHGRFGAVYLVERNADSEHDQSGLGNGMAMKTSRRMYAATRIEREIKILAHLFTKKANIQPPTHITPMFFNGTAGGTPYIIMPMMDANLEKIRREIGTKLPWVDAFYIGQEVLLAVKQCHEHSVVHRDVKPTNVLLSTQNNRNWWICDFGDACYIGQKFLLSPPDALTLPFLSRAAHRALVVEIPATIAWDIESWFYLLLDLFIDLPWCRHSEEAETLAAKNAFWANLDAFSKQNAATLPPQILPIAQIVARGGIDKPYAQLTTLLREGFTKFNEKPPYAPIWLSQRNKPPPPPPPKNQASKRHKVKKRKGTQSGTLSGTSTGGQDSKSDSLMKKKEPENKNDSKKQEDQRKEKNPRSQESSGEKVQKSQERSREKDQKSRKMSQEASKNEKGSKNEKSSKKDRGSKKERGSRKDRGSKSHNGSKKRSKSHSGKKKKRAH